ncbi:hypothetical protein BKA93DRAFT_804629 [Sparassis latifolia]
MDIAPGHNTIARLPSRNVEVYTSENSVIAGFWQYGRVTWVTFFAWLTNVLCVPVDWAIFEYDVETRRVGEEKRSGDTIVQPGHYVLLTIDGGPTRVFVTSERARPRIPTHSETPARDNHYRLRSRARDGKCLITGLETNTYSRLKAAHIFPRAHLTEGYASMITDTLDEAYLGGSSKIDSVQNIITLRSDLHDSWDNYELGVDPDNDYRITAFVNGNADIDGLHLDLSHIQDPGLHPIDELFRDHFMQGLFQHVKGEADLTWDYDDFGDALGEGNFDLSKTEMWGTRQGKEYFELALEDRLLDHRVSQEYPRM